MRAVGIICEYNPLHNGHRFQLEEARKNSGRDTVICVMSGAFVQRGLPAVCDAYTRTGWALKAGADCVIELPVIYSLAPADNFAYGGISILRATGITDAFSCGVSYPDTSLHKTIAAFLNSEPESFSREIRDLMKDGHGYPAAMTQALCSHFPSEQETVTNIMKSANDVLAVRYLKESMKKENTFDFYPVLRSGSVSSSEIRTQLFSEQSTPDLPIPEYVFQDLKNQYASFDYDALLAGMLKRIRPEELIKLPDVSNGLVHHLLENSKKYASAEQIIHETAGKNVTRSHIRRILWYAYLGITRELQTRSLCGIPYIRVLGIRNDRKDILSELRKNATVPVCINASELPENDFALSCARLDALSFDLQALCRVPPVSDLWYRHPLLSEADLSN